MIDINQPIERIIASLTDSNRVNQFEASQMAANAKRGYSNWKRFELARKQEADKRIAISARRLGLI